MIPSCIIRASKVNVPHWLVTGNGIAPVTGVAPLTSGFCVADGGVGGVFEIWSFLQDQAPSEIIRMLKNVFMMSEKQFLLSGGLRGRFFLSLTV